MRFLQVFGAGDESEDEEYEDTADQEPGRTAGSGRAGPT